MSIPNQSDDDNLDEIYGGVDVGEYERPKNLKSKFDSFRERVQLEGKDFLAQSAKGTISGALGAYGDIASLAGINPPEGSLTPSQQQNYGMQSDILDKMNQPGYKPSVSDLSALQDDDISPQPSRLPTSQGLQESIEDVTGIGSPLTAAGSFGKRASQIYGGGLPFGMVNPAPSAAAGGAGEIVESAGGGPIAQAVSEIVTLMATQGRGNPLTSTNPEIRARIQALRQAGYSDRDITLAINASKAGSSRVKGAKATSGSERAFEQTLERSEGLFSEALTEAFPGLERGVEHVHQVASDVYGQVARSGRNVAINNPGRFQRTVRNVITQLRNTLGQNPQVQPLIQRLEAAAQAAGHNPNAETYINFYKELNALGKWIDPKNRERLITHVKNGIKSTFRNSGPEGRDLAARFEDANRGIQRAYQAEEVSNLLNTAATVEGIDWNKMLKLFDKQKNWQVLEEGLGHTQTQNLRQIAKVGKDVGDFQKSLGSMQKGGKLSGWISTAKGGAFVYAIANGHYKTAALLAGSHISKEAYTRLQTRLLTDSRFQNVILRTFRAIKNNSPQEVQRASEAIKKAAEEEGIDVDNL